jgi:hypothetical protein
MATHCVIVTTTETIEYERVIESETELSADDFLVQVQEAADAWNAYPKGGFWVNGIRYDLTGTMLKGDMSETIITRDVMVNLYECEADYPESMYREDQESMERRVREAKGE